MKIRLSAIQTQKQILAPTMQQSIEVLLLPLTELSAAIEEELIENPLLEIDEERTNLEKQVENLINQSSRLLDYAPTPDENPPQTRGLTGDPWLQCSRIPRAE